MLTTEAPRLRSELIELGESLLAEFSGVGNLSGLRKLLDLGVSVDSVYREGDVYFDITRTAPLYMSPHGVPGPKSLRN